MLLFLQAGKGKELHSLIHQASIHLSPFSKSRTRTIWVADQITVVTISYSYRL